MLAQLPILDDVEMYVANAVLLGDWAAQIIFQQEERLVRHGDEGREKHGHANQRILKTNRLESLFAALVRMLSTG